MKVNKANKDIREYVAEVLNDRLNELGWTRYRFLKEAALEPFMPTAHRIFGGTRPVNLSTVAFYADLLGLDIKFVPRETPEETKERIRKFKLQKLHENIAEQKKLI